MTNSIQPPVHSRFSGPPTEELDGLMRRFFKGQMPEPWPAPPPVASQEEMTRAPHKLASHWAFWLQRRVAVAAAVILLVIGYLTLQSWFPDPKPAIPKNPIEKDPIGSNLKGPGKLKPGMSIERTPSGRPVGVEVQPSPSNPNALIIRVEELPAKK